MTTPATHPPQAPRSREEATARIRAHGGRVTAAKEAVLEVLYAPGPPRTAEQLADAASGVDRSVVYRCLRQFEELGIVAHVHLGHGQAVYRRRDATTIPVGCVSCGAVAEVELDDLRELEATVEARTGMRLDLVHFPLMGRCATCRAAG